MYGWRAKIGFMLPSSCTVYEPEFARITARLEGVMGWAARLLIEATDATGLLDMNRHIELAARELGTIEPDLIAYMCTSGSFLEGGKEEASASGGHGKCTIPPSVPSPPPVPYRPRDGASPAPAP